MEYTKISASKDISKLFFFFGKKRKKKKEKWKKNTAIGNWGGRWYEGEDEVNNGVVEVMEGNGKGGTREKKKLIF